MQEDIVAVLENCETLHETMNVRWKVDASHILIELEGTVGKYSLFHEIYTCLLWCDLAV